MPAAVSHGSLTVSITETANVSQPEAFGRGQTVVTPQSNVEVSQDGGQSWKAATLGRDFGRFSFREWHAPVSFPKKGRAQLMVRATSNKGEVQPATASWNPAGYRRNVVESMSVVVA